MPASEPGPSVPRAYRWTQSFLGLIVRMFFRRVHVTGLENIPSRGGGIIVAWHPNALVDPGLIITEFPRQVAFGARHALFDVPLLGSVMRAVGAVPIYRAIDKAQTGTEARRNANTQSLDALAERVASGSFAALFPEGVSHDEPHLMELKTGAARLYYRARARQRSGEPAPVVLPVGLHYDDKQMFRSNALVVFHPPLPLPPDLDVTPPDGEDPAEARDRARRLTGEIERALEEVVYATESWDLHDLMHRVRTLLRAERAYRVGVDPGRTGIRERVLGFARVWKTYRAHRETDPERVEALRQLVQAYDTDLTALALTDRDLNQSPKAASLGLTLMLVLQVVLVYLLLPPILIVGYLVNLPAAVLVVLLARRMAALKKDEASLKLMFGVIAFPLTWLLAGGLAAWVHVELRAVFPSLPGGAVMTGMIFALVGAVGGALSVRYLRITREVTRAFRVRLTRRRRAETIERLRRERAALHDALAEFTGGVDLPGEVKSDGRVAGDLA